MRSQGTCDSAAAMSGILKRKFEEVDGSSPCSSVRESDDEVSSSESADSGDSVNPSTSNHFPPSSILKREKRLRTKNVHFSCVTVYYFTRRQGFTSVPSQGGSTLGMSSRHNSVRQYTLGEFAREQERLHREMLREHLREEKLNSLKLKMTKNGTVESEEASTLTVDDISDDDIDLDNTEVDEYFFLQPLPTKKRRALLRASGVKKIDVEEKHELRAIRLSREDCGCDCRVFCDPETCTCSLAGIKCQVDRMSFPCGCTKEGIVNSEKFLKLGAQKVEDEEEEEDEEDDDKGDSFVDGLGAHAEVVPLPSVLCYSDGGAVHEGPAKGASFYASSSTLYYQIDSHVPGPPGPAADGYSAREPGKAGALSLVPYSMTPEQFADYARQAEEAYGPPHYPAASPSVIVCCSSADDGGVPCTSLYPDRRPSHPQVEFHSYLKGPPPEGFVSPLHGDGHLPEHPAEKPLSLADKSRLHDECITSPVVETVPV
eukprot:XP_013966151.1 cysteine/serine-rich nuclear protein 3 [Canis lupus familiaris]